MDEMTLEEAKAWVDEQLKQVNSPHFGIVYKVPGGYWAEVGTRNGIAVQLGVYGEDAIAYRFNDSDPYWHLCQHHFIDNKD